MTSYLASVDPKRVPLFAGAVVAIVVAALALYVVGPQLKARRIAAEQKTMLETGLGVSAALAAEHAALAETVRRLLSLSASAGEPRSQQALDAAMIRSLQELAWRHSIDLVAIQPREGARLESTQESLFEVELAGEYADLFAYLGDVRRELDPLVVRELALAPLDDAEQPRVRAVLLAAAYGDTR